MSKNELDGAVNFRDIGGYQTKDGHKIAYGKIFRSGDLSKLSPIGLKQFQELGIKQICDFRSSNEIELNPDPVFSNVSYEHMPVLPEDEEVLNPLKSLEKLIGNFELGNEEGILSDLNRKMTEQTSVWKQLLQMLLDESKSPLVFHCAAGKDRTGVGAAIILGTLGVSEEIILEDYEKTNEARDQIKALNSEEMYEEATEHMQKVMDAMLVAKTSYLGSFFDEVRKQYNSFENYLETGLGISNQERDAIRARYLI